MFPSMGQATELVLQLVASLQISLARPGPLCAQGRGAHGGLYALRPTCPAPQLVLGLA